MKAVRIVDDYSAVDRVRSGHTDGPGCWCRPGAYWVHTSEPTALASELNHAIGAAIRKGKKGKRK
jgi:hypothetical protein